MSPLIEDYALIGDLETAALISKRGSIEWLCVPRFDSAACFAAMLGEERHGHWTIAPVVDGASATRRYRPRTLILETEWTTDTGAVRTTDFMPLREEGVRIVRIVEGLRGHVDMCSRLVCRFGYGDLAPWVQRTDHGVHEIAGPDGLDLRCDVPVDPEDGETVARFTVASGDRVAFVLAWHESHDRVPPPIDASGSLDSTARWWEEWCGAGTYDGEYAELVERSLITLKALTCQPTGGIVAAATTSLPEEIGGTRNWDYRYCWIRDATFTLEALLIGGYTDEAAAWRDWLVRAVGGEPKRVQMLYGPGGERLLPEVELQWLPGFEGSSPVRIGNAASEQFQLDVYGELMDTLHTARGAGLAPDEHAWRIQVGMMELIADGWREPDHGIWEMRRDRRQYTHSKVMAWVAVDRAVKAVERFGLDGDVEAWRALRDEIHGDVCEHGYNPARAAFTQVYGGDELDASLLMMPIVGFLPPSDERLHATVDAIGDELCVEGFVRRYRPEETDDGLPGREGVFLPCTFWLADALSVLGRADEARAVFDRAAGLVNDVGLMSEEYDPRAQRMLGNFPQALSHIALIRAAWQLSGGQRRRGD